MSLLHLARNPPRWLRAALASLLLAFALNSLAHVTHRHEATAASPQHSALCGYCISFDSMTPGPANGLPATVTQYAAERIAVAPSLVVSRFARTCAQARAPPVS
jgi:hypothetical protein